MYVKYFKTLSAFIYLTDLYDKIIFFLFLGISYSREFE